MITQRQLTIGTRNRAIVTNYSTVPAYAMLRSLRVTVLFDSVPVDVRLLMTVNIELIDMRRL